MAGKESEDNKDTVELGIFLFDPAFFKIGKLRDMVKEERPKEEILRLIDEIVKLEHDREKFCEKVTAQPSTALSKIIEETMDTDWEGLRKEGKTNVLFGSFWMTSNREVQFLKSMVSMNKCKRALEVGLFTGCGALAIAEALPADGVVVTCEWDPFIAQLARKFLYQSSHGRKVQIKEGPASETCRKLGDEGQQFDFIYMDANKDGYIEIYDIIKEKNLLAPNGTIVADNALHYGTAYMDENSPIGKFDRHVLADPSVHRILLPIRDGVMIIRKLSDVEVSS